MEDIYSLSDREIAKRIGEKTRACRLRQNITQASLAKDSEISLSSLQKIESGEIKSFDSLLRVLRTLGLLDDIRRITEQDEISPAEYYEIANSKKKHMRKRAKSQRNGKKEEASEW